MNSFELEEFLAGYYASGGAPIFDMSIHAMGKVWDSGLYGSDLVYALALADHAHDDGTSIKPGTRRIRNKTKMSRATVQRKRAKAEAEGWLVLEEERPGRPWLYKMVFEKLPPFVKIEHRDDGPEGVPQNEAPQEDSNGAMRRGVPQNEAPQEDSNGAMRRGVPHLGEAGGASQGEALTVLEQVNNLPVADARQRAEGARASDAEEANKGSAAEPDPATSCEAIGTEAEERWAQLRAAMERRFGIPSFRSWTGKLELVRWDDHGIVLEAPTKFLADKIETMFLHEIRQLARCAVRFVFKSGNGVAA